MKYRIHFVGSAFVTARVRISHFPSLDIPSSIEEYAGDIVSTVVDIRGDTIVEFTVPYLGARPYAPVVGFTGYGDVWDTFLPTSDNYSVLVFSWINPITEPSPDGVGSIWMNIWQSAAEDFVFNGLVRKVAQLPCGAVAAPPAATLHSAEQAFSKPFQPMAPAHAAIEAGLVRTESIDTIEHICQRYYPYIQGTGITNPLPNALENNTLDNIWHCAQLFRYYRGGMRYKIYTPPTPQTYHSSGVDYPFYAPQCVSAWLTLPQQQDHSAEAQILPGPISYAYNSVNGVLELEIPWMSLNYARDIYGGLYPSDDDPRELINFSFAGNEVATATWLGSALRSVADDFTFGVLLAPPLQTYTPYVPPVLGKSVDPKRDVDHGVPRLTAASSNIRK